MGQAQILAKKTVFVRALNNVSIGSGVLNDDIRRLAIKVSNLSFHDLWVTITGEVFMGEFLSKKGHIIEEFREINLDGDPIQRLQTALIAFLGTDELTAETGLIINNACEKGRISFSEVEEICGGNAEDVLLLCWEWRLLVPVRSSKCGEWDDRLLVLDPGEIYELPNVVKHLVNSARRTGQWDPDVALTEVFSDTDETLRSLIPDLLKKMNGLAHFNIINAFQIRQACARANVNHSVDTLIALLKAGGVISPKLRALSDVVKAM